MTIKVGDTLPSVTLLEMTESGSQEVPIDTLTRGKRIVLFGLPGAFTPTCSAKHVPGYVSLADTLKAERIDEIACISVNDVHVMGAWAKDQGAGGKVRMLADGSAAFTRAIGLDMDLSARGMGVRSKRYSMLVDDGKVVSLNVEAPGKFEVSNAETMLEEIKNLK